MDPRLVRARQERTTDEGWRTRGLCQAVDPEKFFPAASEPADDAIALCRSCLVQGPCLAWALDVGDCHGVWGGTTPRERRAMLIAWQAEPALVAPAERQLRIIPVRVPSQRRRVTVQTGAAALEPAGVGAGG